MLKMTSSVLFRKGPWQLKWPRFFSLDASSSRHADVSEPPDMKNSSTVNETEMQHFTDMSKKWWDYDGPVKALHSMNCLRIPFIRNGLMNSGRLPCDAQGNPSCFTGVKILDVGCGGGILAIPLARLGAEVTAIDPNKDLIVAANERVKIERDLMPDISIEFKLEAIEDHVKNHREKYDAVILSEVIEHITQQEEFLHTCVESVKPGGSVFITTLNKTCFSWAFGIVVAENILRLLPQGTHEYEKFVSPETVKEYLSNCDCDTKLVNGMLYIPFQNKWYWAPITHINYALHAVKREGD